MPTQAEMAAATAIDSIGAQLLGAYLRASTFYLTFSWAFKGLDAKVTETIASDSNKAKMLGAILTELDEIGDGTVGASGGDAGADYSQSRDREQLCLLALSVIYDFAELGIVLVDGVPVMPGAAFASGTGLRGGDLPDLRATQINNEK